MASCTRPLAWMCLFVAAASGCRAEGRASSDPIDARTTPLAIDEARIDSLVKQMSLEEKITFLHGSSFTAIDGVARLGIRPLTMTDGPLGVRFSTGGSTAMPAGMAMASTWNPALVQSMASVLGQETAANHFAMLLAPGINIVRTPIGGRTFEYLSEDPHLVAEIGSAYVRGVQSQDVSVCVKHFAVNSVERERETYDSQIDERTMREIYLPGFKAAIEAGATSVMAAFNKVNGTYCTENPFLLRDVLETEWGFKGPVISDWWSIRSSVPAALAGLTVDMPGDSQFFGTTLLDAVRMGQVGEQIIDDKVKRVLRVVSFTGGLGAPTSVTIDAAANAAVSRHVAEEGIVLLKNTGILPLDPKKLRTVAVIGPNATRLNSSGGGSATVPARYEVTPIEGIEKRLGTPIAVTQAAVRTDVALDDNSIAAAVAAASAADVALVFVGTDKSVDTEGSDKPDLRLLPGHDALVAAVAAANPKTVVVLINGSAVEMPWADSVAGIVEAWYAGMESGTAIAEVLFGDVNPSGKLPITFPRQLSDVPAHANGNYPPKNGVLRYDEGILVGYRHYDTKSVLPLFPFGHGLSYTTFEYSNLRVAPIGNGGATATVSVRNTGSREGMETVQLYVHPTESAEMRPDKELKAFRKVHLNPGETSDVTLTLDQSAFEYWSAADKKWVLQPAVFRILVASSSRDVRAAYDLDLSHPDSSAPAAVPDAGGYGGASNADAAAIAPSPAATPTVHVGGGCSVGARRRSSAWALFAGAAGLGSIAGRRRKARPSRTYAPGQCRTPRTSSLPRSLMCTCKPRGRRCPARDAVTRRIR
jgi:beta-glucosidase